MRACPRLGLPPALGGLAGVRAGRGAKVHTLYVQLANHRAALRAVRAEGEGEGEGEGGRAAAEDTTGVVGGAAPRVMLGCFEDAQLLRRATWREATRRETPGGGGDGDRDGAPRGIARCAAACAAAAYFAVGRPTALLPACACADLPPVAWRRNERGMSQLKEQQLKRVAPTKAASAAVGGAGSRRRTKAGRRR